MGCHHLIAGFSHQRLLSSKASLSARATLFRGIYTACLPMSSRAKLIHGREASLVVFSGASSRQSADPNPLADVAGMLNHVRLKELGSSLATRAE